MWPASKAKKKKKSKWTGRYWFNSASDWLREWLEFSEPFRERGKAKSRQSQMKSLLTFFFKLKLYKGKHVSSKKKHPLFQAITFLFLIVSFCLFVFRCLNSRLYFQSGSCCFFILPDHCTSLFQIQLRWIVYRDDHEDNKNSFQSESS